MNLNNSILCSPKIDMNFPKRSATAHEFNKINSSPEMDTYSPKGIGFNFYCADIKGVINKISSPETGIYLNNNPGIDEHVQVDFIKKVPQKAIGNSPKEAVIEIHGIGLCQK